MSTGSTMLKMTLGAAASVAALTITTGANAQPNPIDHCREASSTDQERIACLEAAITGLMSAGQPVASVEAPDSEEEARLAAAETAEADVPTGIGAEQVIAKTERATKEGREKRKEKIKAEAINATLVDFARTGTGRLIFVLDNGQVWSQRKSDRQEVRLRDGDTPSVKVRRGAFSGYRMELSKPNVTIVVERLK